MTLEDLKPVLDMLTLQEERLVRKIDEVHDDVRETKKDLKALNGSVRTNKDNIADIKANCSLRTATCGRTIDNLENALPAIRTVSKMFKKPKTYVVGALLVIVGIQILVMESIEHGWITKILELVKIIK